MRAYLYAPPQQPQPAVQPSRPRSCALNPGLVRPDATSIALPPSPRRVRQPARGPAAAARAMIWQCARAPKVEEGAGDWSERNQRLAW